MKSLAQQFVEKRDALKAKGVDVSTVIAGINTIEAKLVAMDAKLSEGAPIKKNNGVADNYEQEYLRESARADQHADVDARLIESFMALGFSEAEAKVAAGGDSAIRDGEVTDFLKLMENL